MTKEEFLTTAEVAKLLKVSSGTVQKIAREGRISALKVGHLWRFPLQSPGILLYKQEQKSLRRRKSAKEDKDAGMRRNGLKELAKLATDLGFIEPFQRDNLYGRSA